MIDCQPLPGEIRDCAPIGIRFLYREAFGATVSMTSKYRCVGVTDDPTGMGFEVRVEPYPNPAKPESAAYSWFSRAEWNLATPVPQPPKLRPGEVNPYSEAPFRIRDEEVPFLRNFGFESVKPMTANFMGHEYWWRSRGYGDCRYNRWERMHKL